jgi:DNA-binding NarL/FixJ family response regulator
MEYIKYTRQENGEMLAEPMTDKEIKSLELGIKIYKEQEAIRKQKEKNRQSALAKLAALGLTEEEIAAL